MPQLKAEVEDLNHFIALQRSVHQTEAEGLCAVHKLKVEQLHSTHSTELKLKDSFCKAKKIHVLVELQVDYKSKLLRLYDE